MRPRLLVALALIAPLGLLAKAWPGPAGVWVRDHGAGLLYDGAPTARVGCPIEDTDAPRFAATRGVSGFTTLWEALAILIASARVPRFYCRYICPLGAALALGSLVSLNRIRRVEQCAHCKVCEQKCPTGAIRGDRVDFKECVRCNVCEIELLEKTGVCRHDMEMIRPRLVQLKTQTPAGLSDVVLRSPAP